MNGTTKLRRQIKIFVIHQKHTWWVMKITGTQKKVAVK